MSYVSRTDYCQFLLVTQTNYTATYFANHRAGYSHDAVKRYLEEDAVDAQTVWEAVRGDVVTSEEGYVVFDDTVLDKQSSHKIELVRRQYSGNAHAVIKGIGVVTCVYVNPVTDQFWVIDYRLYDPDGDGKTKLEHVREMFDETLQVKRLPCRGVLMDSWYAERKLMMHIERAGKLYYAALRRNRLADDSDEAQPYQRLEDLTWTEREQQTGKRVHLKDFPSRHRLTLFRLVRSPTHTDYIVTNDAAQHATADTQTVCALRWKVEQFHREVKQVTGIERAQCRLARMQRNHIGCALLVWVHLKRLATQTGITLYQVKQRLLDDYLTAQLHSPSIVFA